MAQKHRITGDMIIPITSNNFASVTALPTRVGTEHKVLNTFNNPYTRLGKQPNARDFRNIGGPFSTFGVKAEPLFGSGLSPRKSATRTGSTETSGYYGVIVPHLAVKQALELAKARTTSSSAYVAAVSQHVPSLYTLMEMYAAGTTAISRVIPTNPLVDLSTTIGEFIGERKFFSLPGKAGNLSGEYLNVQLAVIPFLSEGQDLLKAMESHDATLAQHERDSGKLIRRRYEFDPKNENTRIETTGVYPEGLGVGNVRNFATTGTLTTSTSSQEKTWFSGAFSYYLPKSGWRRTLSDAQRLYGVTPGLETLWNVIPLSFVADYFINLGDVLHNLDAFSRDGLIMPYGFVMRSSETVTTYSWSGQIRNSVGTYEPRKLDWTITKSYKQRVAATPFGFGVAEESLDPRQLSILAALGLSRR